MACGSDDPAAPPEYIPSFVSGHLRYNDAAHTPIASAEITLAQLKNDGGYGSGWWQTSWHMTTCTDSDGYYSFKYDARNANQYHVMICPYEYACSAPSLNVPHGTQKNLNITVNHNDDLTLCP